ncbi:uncharacterized protein LOC101901290 [Musca domestica]|uniref:Uncharacterized protein LOC101901290 n=1 Tax=Musca domestica TaxID=7370 RepID=A0A1I8NAL2_MUSDO|nr:uncharacterized protein LOC101901290 [Musca domestica]
MEKREFWKHLKMKNPLITLIFMGCLLMDISQSAVIVKNPKLNDISKGEEGFLELRPNGNLILRSTLENSPNTLQQALLFQSILNAIRAVPGNTLNELNVKIYGEGVEHKFPPFLERVIQRIQTYFSVYKYTDTTEPMRDKYKPLNDSHYEEIDVTLSSDNVELVKNKTGKPLAETTAMTSATAAVATTTTVGATAAVTTMASAATTSTISNDRLTTTPLPDQSIVDDEENEFIEIKKLKESKKKIIKENPI